jgi:uncharacterized membrane protein
MQEPENNEKNEEIKDQSTNENDILDPLDEELNELAHDLLDSDFDELSEGDQKIIEHIAESESIAENPNTTYSDTITFGQKLSDDVARIGGSWAFVIISLVILIIWVFLNSKYITGAPWDPYPYILLNLVLSMVAALQAPIIMMSQNRQAEKDRISANANYEVCLKMELEITRLHQRFEELETKLNLPEAKNDSP